MAQRRAPAGAGSGSRYNDSVLRTVFVFALILLLAAALPALAQQDSATVTVLVLPFENHARTPGLEWISESFPEILGQRLSGAGSLFLISRADRLYAFDRLGIPANLRASRATLYRIAEQLDADYLVLGDFSSDGQTITANAQVLDMRALRLSPPLTESGPLTSILQVEGTLAFDVLKAIRPESFVSRDFLQAGGIPRLDAFENYIRGIVAPTREEKLLRFREAVRLDPQYSAALLQLGRANYEAHQYEQAVEWLNRVPADDPSFGEAHFLMGLSEYLLGQFDKAEADFLSVLDRVPLPELENDAGAAASRRGGREALAHFERALQADLHDPDYRFNLALAQVHFGETAAAGRNLHELLLRQPNDAEAKQLLDALSAPGAPAAPARLPLPRLKRNYDESTYRELQLEMENAAELAMAHASPVEHAAFHAQRGHYLLSRGLVAPAEDEFREAVSRDPNNAEAHAGLARIAELRNQPAAARAEAETSLRLQPNAAALLVLARLDIAQNRLDDAERELQQAAALDASNPALAEAQHELASRRAAAPH